MYTKKLSWIDNKSVLVIGMAREGLSTVEFLLQHLEQPKIYVTDNKNLNDLDQTWQKLINQDQRITFLTTDECPNFNFEIVFKTPGIPHRILEEKYRLDLKSTKLYSNTQLFFDLIADFETKPLTIGITGTKGKSTTTSMVYHVLSENLPNVYLAGNIGVPPLRLLDKAQPIDKNIFVLEMSCHQLADLKTSPNIAVALDISPDHLDYYPTFEDYFQAKTAICRFQEKNDLVLFNNDSKTAQRMAKLSQANHQPFSLKDKELTKFIHRSNSPLVGEHNLYNTMPAILIARKLKIADKDIAHSISTFKPVSHRLELVKIVNGVSYYDDSASSAPEATVAALKAFAQKEIVLIAGGSEKGVEFDTLAKAILSANLRHLILFPTTGEKILHTLLELSPNHHLSTAHHFAHSMSEAVKLASETSQNGDVVLLSPACASFNMFKNYEDRGDQFKQAVKAL